jgi:preprotein translocase subunit Sec61beta
MSWVAHWIVLRATGQGYSVRVLYAGWQFLPPDAVAAAPLRSVWSLHTQPPGWNFLVAAIHAWSPLSTSASHQVVTVLLGAALAGTIADTLTILDVPGRWAIGVSAVATMNSQVMSNAFEPRYDLAVTALLAVLVWAAVRFRTLLPGVAVALALVMTRSLFHPIWLVMTVALLAFVARSRPTRRQLAWAIAVPVVVVGGWTVKNATQFGTVGLSSFTGMNLLRSVEPAVGDAAMAELVDDGTVSGVAGAGTFRFYDDYAPSMPWCTPDPDDPAVLASPTKPIPAELRVGLDPADTANFNYRCYLAVYERAGDDAIAILRARPGDWLKARGWAINNWFQVPAASTPDESPLWDVEVLAGRALLLGVPHPGLPGRWDALDPWVHRNPVSITLIASTAISIVGATTVALDSRRQRRRRMPSASVPALVVWLLAWNSFAGIVFELGEQERFRSTTDPLVLAVAAWWVLRRLGRTAADATPEPAEPAKA